MTRAEALALLRAMTNHDFPTVDAAEEPDEAQVSRLVSAGRRTAGRPSLTGTGARSPQITVRLPQEVNDRLSQVASRTGRRRSEVVRDALELYLAPT